MGFLVTLNTIIMGFVFALRINIMDFFVALSMTDLCICFISYRETNVFVLKANNFSMFLATFENSRRPKP